MPKLSNYNKDALADAIREYNSGGTTLRAVAKKYDVPRATIQFKLKNPDHKVTFGPAPVLTKLEEDTLVNWILELAKKGFDVKKENIISSVQGFLIANPRPNPFKDNRPGEGWIKAFFKRHPKILKKAVTSASSCVVESDIRKWFKKVDSYLKTQNLEKVMKDPSRIFHGNESGFHICPSTGRAKHDKGPRNPCLPPEKGSSKENLTVMFTFSANGKFIPPLLVCPYQRIPQTMSALFPQSWGIAGSENGWMSGEVFFEYISNVFQPHLVKQSVKFPVILFLNGHKSHLTYQLSRFCKESGIELIAMYPDDARTLQPADVTVFQPIQLAWKKCVKDWCAKHPGEPLITASFAPLLKEVLDEVAKPGTLTKEFETCGLFPFNPDAVDYSMCLVEKESDCTSDEIERKMPYQTFVSIVGEDAVRRFMLADEDYVEDEDFAKLYSLWKYFQCMSQLTEGQQMKESNAIK